VDLEDSLVHAGTANKDPSIRYGVPDGMSEHPKVGVAKFSYFYAPVPKLMSNPWAAF
jgi:hypothetical protein